MRLSPKHFWVLLAIPVSAALMTATKSVHAGAPPAVSINTPSYDGVIPDMGVSFTVSGAYRGNGNLIRVDVCEADSNGNMVYDSNGDPVVVGSASVGVSGSPIMTQNWQLTMQSPAYPGERYILVASFLYPNGSDVCDDFWQPVYS